MKLGHTYHCHISVRGYIERLSCRSREAKRVVRGMTVNGRQATPEEAREWLMDQLAQGHEAVPIGDPCDGWDWKTGCQGHPCEMEAKEP